MNHYRVGNTLVECSGEINKRTHIKITEAQYNEAVSKLPHALDELLDELYEINPSVKPGGGGIKPPPPPGQVGR